MQRSDFPATIWHNPRCSTSRNALALVRHCGIEPEIVDYQRAPLARAGLKALIAAAGLSVREAMRSKDARFAELGLADPALSEAQLLDVLEREPALLNRPFLRTPRGVVLCRPLERALELLPPPATPFVKENGEPLLP